MRTIDPKIVVEKYDEIINYFQHHKIRTLPLSDSLFYCDIA